MRKQIVTVVTFLLVVTAASGAWATNGDNLIGVGPISRSMGGVGVAAPQDAISAVFANPAAMCFGPYCPGSEATFGGTFFDPTVKSKIDFTGLGQGSGSAKSRMNPFIVPAIGITSPITDRLRFALGAYGVSGMGVDYKETATIYQNLYTKLEIMKFAPNFAYLVTPDFSVGASFSVDYGNLDLGQGGAHDYAYGVQLGALYHYDMYRFGASYTSPQKTTHERVYDFNNDGTKDTLKLESPQTLVFGIAVEPTPRFLVEFDVKWLNWSDAAGYDAFDWEDQWVYAVGMQYKPMDRLALRAGFNYGKNPVKEHEGFNPMGTTNVQGVPVSNPSYETLRIVGFPAIAEKHLTLGLGYELTKDMVVNLSYMHAFETKIKESAAGGAAHLESTMDQDSLSMSFTWRF